MRARSSGSGSSLSVLGTSRWCVCLSSFSIDLFLSCCFLKGFLREVAPAHVASNVFRRLRSERNSHELPEGSRDWRHLLSQDTETGPGRLPRSRRDNYHSFLVPHLVKILLANLSVKLHGHQLPYF